MAEFFRWVPVIYGVGFLVVLILLRRQRSHWSELAESASLEFDAGGLLRPVRVFGTYRGRPLLIDTTARYGPRRSIPCMRVQLPTRGLGGLSLTVHKKSGLDKLANKLQPTEHLAIGADLTREYSIEVRPPQFAATLMGYGSPIQRLWKQAEVHVFQAANDELYFETVGIYHDKDKVLAVINILVDIAEHCESVLEETHPHRSFQGRALPSETQYLEKKQIIKRGKYGTLLIVILAYLVPLSPFICMALLEYLL